MNSFFRKKNKELLVLLILLPLIMTFTIMNAETIYSWTPENEQEEKSAEEVIGEIFFPEELIQGEVDYVLDFIFYSEDALETVDLALPEQVIIDQEALMEGLTAVKTENEGVWQLISETPQTTFVLPIIVDTIGEYELIVAESASQRLLIVENTVIEDTDQDEDENDSAEAAQEEEGEEASDAAAKEAEVDDRSEQMVEVTIDKNNFREHFDVQGTATYNEETGLLVLTEDITWSVGYVTLKDRISLDQPFTLKGRANTTTLQLYSRDDVTEVARPMRELKQWQKIHLAAAEERQHSFYVTPEDFAYVHSDFSTKSDPGTISLYLGFAAASAKLIGTLTI